jgi:hypothetical protein
VLVSLALGAPRNRSPIIEKRVTLSIKKEHTAVVTESVTMSESFIVTDYVTSSRVDLYFIDPL